MNRSRCAPALALTAVLAVGLLAVPSVNAACCYFSAKDQDILQPAQKVFITWDPVQKHESFTVQPKFEGNALDFGMVIPTPTQPKLHEMPRDFFKRLAVYSILAKRESPVSKLLPRPEEWRRFWNSKPNDSKPSEGAGKLGGKDQEKKPAVRELESGTVGSLDYKILEADRADALYQWLKKNKYHYAGDEATLEFYVQKKYLFTVMKIDTLQMKKNKDGSFAGEVTPTRFSFSTEKLMYPLKITQISVKDKTEALFYVAAPNKVDLDGDFSYQHTWVPMLQAATGCTPGGIQGGGEQWINKIRERIPALQQRSQQLGFNFQPGQRPQPGKDGRIPTTMEWSRKLTDKDVKMIVGDAPYCEKVPNVDEGFTEADVKDPQKREAIFKVIRARLAKAQQERPFGYWVRHAPDEDVQGLRDLSGHLTIGSFITKFRKIFLRNEMNDDLLIVPSKMGDQEDESEYQEVLPTSPP